MTCNPKMNYILFSAIESGWLLGVGLAGGRLCGGLLFAWLSLVMSVVVSFCAVLYPTRCLG